jgi:creatinine amidohydrolase
MRKLLDEAHQSANHTIEQNLRVGLRNLRNAVMKFHEMTAPEIRSVKRDASVVLAPIAACEQHGRHLPTYTDTILCTAVAEGVESRLAQEVLLLPTLWLGASHHHLRYGGTLSADVDMHVAILTSLLEPLLVDGFQRVMILNGHGGNIDTLHVALRKLQNRYPNRHLTGASYWELAEKELAILAEGPRKSMGHACEFETSMVLALRPDLVRRDAIKDDPPSDDAGLRGLFTAEDMYQKTDHGCVGFPERASVPKGRACLDAAIARTCEVVFALLRKPLPR